MIRGNEPVERLTIREWIATAALQGVVPGDTQAPELIADRACKIADALIARLNGAAATPSRLPEERP